MQPVTRQTCNILFKNASTSADCVKPTKNTKLTVIISYFVFITHTCAFYFNKTEIAHRQYFLYYFCSFNCSPRFNFIRIEYANLTFSNSGDINTKLDISSHFITRVQLNLNNSLHISASKCEET